MGTGKIYDLWNIIIDAVIGSYFPLFDAMHSVAEDIQISKPLVDELRQIGEKEVVVGDFHLMLSMELYNDKIGGFKISVLAYLDQDDFEEVKEMAANAAGLTLAQIRSFEAEHGLDLTDEILEEVEEEYGIDAKVDNCIMFEFVAFDTDDIDKSIIKMSDEIWR